MHFNNIYDYDYDFVWIAPSNFVWTTSMKHNLLIQKYPRITSRCYCCHPCAVTISFYPRLKWIPQNHSDTNHFCNQAGHRLSNRKVLVFLVVIRIPAISHCVLCWWQKRWLHVYDSDSKKWTTNAFNPWTEVKVRVLLLRTFHLFIFPWTKCVYNADFIVWTGKWSLSG